jgi:hypothetical protein
MIDLAYILPPLFSLLIGGLLGKELYRVLDKPRVIIQYKRYVLFKQEDGYFLSIKIANAGRSSAVNCIGTLTIFNIENDEIINPDECEIFENLHEYREENYNFENPRPQYVTRDSFYELSNEPLCWADLGNPHTISINPGTTHRLDICKYFKNSEKSYFIIPSDQGWRKLRIRVRAEKLDGRLLICPSNDFPTPIDFSLSVKDNGEPELQMRKLKIPDKINFKFRKSRAFLNQ